jgi:hypothetical protein
MTHEYLTQFTRYEPDTWKWSLCEDKESMESYRRFCMKREGNDHVPEFGGIEKFLNSIGVESDTVEIAGMKWSGVKGCHVLHEEGYDMELFEYDDDIEDFILSGYVDPDCKSVSGDLARLPENFVGVADYGGRKKYVDCNGIASMYYKYTIENHFLKDSFLEIKYEDGGKIFVFGHGILDFIRAAKERGIDIGKFKDQLNEHLKKLEDNDWNMFDKEWYESQGLRGKTADDIIDGGVW